MTRSIAPREPEFPLRADSGTESPIVDALLELQSGLGEGALLLAPGRILQANGAFARLVGTSVDALHGIDLLELVPPAERARMRLPQAADHERSWRHETMILTPEGPARVELLAQRVDDAEPRWVVLVRNLTSRHAAEAELESARRQVAHSERLALLGSLVSGLAHEIRTPLAYLGNHISIIETRIARALQPGADTHALLADLPGHAANAHEGVDRINRLVKDLRRFIRMEEETRRMSSLHEVVQDALRLYTAAHRDRATIRSDLEPTPPIPLDPGQLQQVVINLLDNAAEASSTPTARVHVRTKSLGGGGAQLIIQDDGVGIPHDVIERMFEPFFSTKPEGTGLGLSIVRRIVESHGGSIHVDTRLGKGTTFTITLPL